jgi:hypothetical protein
MTKLDEGFEALSRARTPDLWAEIERRDPSRVPPSGPGRGRRVLAGAVALVVAIAGIGFAWRAFTRTSPPQSSTPTSEQTLEPSAEPSVDVTGPVPVGVPFQTNAIVADADGVWVRYYDNAGGHLARLDPDTLETVAVIDDVPTAGWDSGGGGMALDSGGIWVAGDGELVFVDASTERIAQRIPLAGAGSADVTKGALGVWVLETGSNPDRMLVESVDTIRGVATVTTEMPFAYARRIVEVGGYLAVISLTQSDPSGVVGDPRLTLLDWESGGHPIESLSGRPFPSACLIDYQGDGWTFSGSALTKLDGVNLLKPIDAIDLPVARIDRLIGGAGGLWIATNAGEVLRIDPVSSEVDVRMDLPKGAGWSDAAATDDAVYLMGWDGTVTRIAVGG